LLVAYIVELVMHGHTNIKFIPAFRRNRKKNIF